MGYKEPMRTHSDVVRLWDTHRELSELLGCSRARVQQMDSLDRIPAQYWSIICEHRPAVRLRELAEHIRVV